MQDRLAARQDCHYSLAALPESALPVTEDCHAVLGSGSDAYYTRVCGTYPSQMGCLHITSAVATGRDDKLSSRVMNSIRPLPMSDCGTGWQCMSSLLAGTAVQVWMYLVEASWHYEG